MVGGALRLLDGFEDAGGALVEFAGAIEAIAVLFKSSCLNLRRRENVTAACDSLAEDFWQESIYASFGSAGRVQLA